jgi:hypothetical protein
LKLQCVTLLSSIAFGFNLRRYAKAIVDGAAARSRGGGGGVARVTLAVVAGAYTRPHLCST